MKIEIETRTKPTTLENANKLAEILMKDDYVVSVRKYKRSANNYFVFGRKLMPIEGGDNSKDN